MKQRASSLSALQHEGQVEDSSRSGSSQGFRTSTLTSDGMSLAENNSTNMEITRSSLSKSSENNLDLSDINMTFDDIESALFFKRPSSQNEENPEALRAQTKKPETKKKSVFSFRNLRIRKTDSNADPKEKSHSLFRNATFRFDTFRTSGSPTAGHPDVNSSSGRRCTIL